MPARLGDCRWRGSGLAVGVAARLCGVPSALGRNGFWGRNAFLVDHAVGATDVWHAGYCDHKVHKVPKELLGVCQGQSCDWFSAPLRAVGDRC